MFLELSVDRDKTFSITKAPMYMLSVALMDLKEIMNTKIMVFGGQGVTNVTELAFGGMMEKLLTPFPAGRNGKRVTCVCLAASQKSGQT